MISFQALSALALVLALMAEAVALPPRQVCLVGEQARRKHVDLTIVDCAEKRFRYTFGRNGNTVYVNVFCDYGWAYKMACVKGMSTHVYVFYAKAGNKKTFGYTYSCDGETGRKRTRSLLVCSDVLDENF